MTDNPLFAPSSLPYELPPFAQIRDEHYLPALEQAMAQQAAEIATIAAQADPPTFANTIEAMERAGLPLTRVRLVFGNKAATDSNPVVRGIEAEIAPRLAAHQDSIRMNQDLFGRVNALHDLIDSITDPEQRRLLDRYHTDFVRAGAALPAQDRERLKGLNAELAAMETAFDQNLLADTNAALVVVDTVEELDGLSDDAIAAAAETANERGFPGKYAISLRLPTAQPALESLTNRALRQRLFEASIGRGGKANGELAIRLATLRAERARLLGFETHADYVIADETASTTEAVTKMLGRITPAAVTNAEREAADLQVLAGDEPLAPWDWPYYAEKVRKARYDIDAAAVRPYLELERVLKDGVFFAAQKLYGITFTERPDLIGYLPEVRVYEVSNEDGSALGLFLADFYSRPGKRGGLWMSQLVQQSRLNGCKPVVINNFNLSRPPGDQPTLLTMDDVNGLFHEFGHALHGLFSSVGYPRFSGTSVPRDFVEYPSQVNEMWATWPEVLANYARHYQTGEPMPAELVERMRQAQQFNEGYRTTEYLAATLLDLAWHRIPAGEEPTDAAAFEAAALANAGTALEAIPPRYKTTYFSHSFGGDYSAAYYSYIWSEVLDADTVEWFTENGGLLRENGDAFRAKLLSRGGSVDPMEAFRAVRGREPSIEPLLARRGLA
ncbi:MAG TPA: peptidase M3 [Micromonosporaceae bacterium]|nr:peptidase M3 [Micromonosporaceae bacterium]HCU52269.1 peptidase M3 [Micromonosporaceae bacterium]